MTNAEVRSVIQKMLVEQQTIVSLLPQFTVALQLADEVIKRFDEAAPAVAELDQTKRKLEQDISELTPIFNKRKEQAIAEEAQFRKDLEKESEVLRNSVSAARERLAQANRDADAKLKANAELDAQMRAQVKVHEDKIASLKEAFEQLRKEHNL